MIRIPLSDGERQQICQLIEDAGGDANPSGWFEPLYHQAQGDAGEVLGLYERKSFVK